MLCDCLVPACGLWFIRGDGRGGRFFVLEPAEEDTNNRTVRLGTRVNSIERTVRSVPNTAPLSGPLSIKRTQASDLPH